MIRIGTRSVGIGFPRIKTSFSARGGGEIIENPEDRSLERAIQDIRKRYNLSLDEVPEIQNWGEFTEFVNSLAQFTPLTANEHNQRQKDILKERVKNAVATGKIPEQEAESIKTVDQFNAAISLQRKLKNNQ